MTPRGARPSATVDVDAAVVGAGFAGLDRIEASPGAEDAWGRHVSELADATLYPRASSWYVGANIPGKPRVFMPYVAGCGNYRRECEEIVERGCEGFVPGRER
jgi:hypothetical protein